LFPHDKYVIVDQGFEWWMGWRYVITFQGDFQALLDGNFSLSRPINRIPGETADHAASFLRDQIDTAMNSGKHVVACSLWSEKPEQFANTLTTLTTLQQALEYDARLRAAYRVGSKWDTQVGPFVELLPLETDEADEAASIR
jgi:hypothetical protein